MMAELRMYQNPSQGKWATSGREFTITVYSIVKANGHDRELEVLSSINTTADYQGWLEMNVTEGLSAWLQNPKENRGIYIGAHAVTKPDREIKLDDIGLVHPRGDDEYQPFMIGFFRGPEVSFVVLYECKNYINILLLLQLIKTVKRHSRQKRNTHPRRRKKTDIVNPLIDGPSESVRSCQMQTLYIDFKDLGWRVSIIIKKIQ